MIALSVVLFSIYAILEGYREAIHFYYLNKVEGKKIEEHSMFAIQRIIVWIPIELINFQYENPITLLNGLFIAFVFIFWHAGTYYWKRNKLDNSYPLGFLDQSKTSTSMLDRLNLTGPILRTIYFSLGILGLIIINYVKY